MTEADALQLAVCNLAGETLLEPLVAPTSTVRDLKLMVWSAGGPEVARQRLLLGDRILEEARSLAESGIEDRCQLLCLCIPTSEDLKNRVHAIACCRPMSAHEISRGCERSVTVDPTQGTVCVDREDNVKKFQLDRVFAEDTSQQELFDAIGVDLVQNVLEGWAC